MAAEFQKWMKIASDLRYEGTELREFVRVKQEECKAERLAAREREEKKRVEDIAREEKKRVEDIAREEKKQALGREDRLRAEERVKRV